MPESVSVRPGGRLHDLGQHPAHVLGMDEEDRRAVRADARLAEHLRALALEPRLPGVDIGHVHLKVADLDRALAFYVGVLGFQLTQMYGSALIASA